MAIDQKRHVTKETEKSLYLNSKAMEKITSITMRITGNNLPTLICEWS